MAITWGSYVNNSSGNGMRLGYEFSQSPSSVGTGTSSVEVTMKLYFGSKASVSDSTNSYDIAGDFSGSGAASISHSGADTTLIRTLTITVSTSYTATKKVDFDASITGINAISGTASVSGAWTVAKRPISAPAAPTALNVSRSSDTRQDLSWTNTSPTSASNPYTNIEVQRWDNVSNAWSAIATLGVVTSYANTSTVGNKKYRYRVRAKNSAGTSAWAYSSYISTTPSAPTGVAATKGSANITLTWTNTATAGTGVEVWHASDGVWETARLALLTGQPTTWTHTAPDATKTHTYKLKAQGGTDADDVAPTLYSVFSADSNTVQLQTPPAAPTQLAPASAVRDTTDPIILTWKHNPLDTTAQTAYEVQYRVNGGAWTATGKIASGTSSLTIAAGTWPNGATVEWQVRTWGQHATASPYSATAIITTSDAPGVSITVPDTSITTSRLAMQWTYSDTEGTAQTEYRVGLYTAGGETLLEEHNGVGADTAHEFGSILANGGTYRATAQVRDGHGLWSPETFEDFTVAYALPPVPTFEALWDPETASVSIAVQNPVPAAGEETTDHIELWRSTDQRTYELVADNIPPNTAVTDYIPRLGGDNVYKVVAVTAIGAVADSAPLTLAVPAPGSWWFFNGGPDFSELIRVRYNPDRARSFSRAKTLNQFAGREYPVETAGEARTRDLDLTVSVLGDDDAGIDAIEAVADLPAPICLRTPTGDRRYVSIKGVSASASSSIEEKVSLEMTQVAPPAAKTMPLAQGGTA